MRRGRLLELLEGVRRGEVEPEQLLGILERAPTAALGFANVDHHRALRLGHPEAVYCEGKEVSQVLEICRSLADHGEGFLATRASPQQLDRLEAEFPALEVSSLGRIAHLPPEEPAPQRVRGVVAILTAGTVDLPVAEEARFTARALGNPVELRADVGIAGLHRLLTFQDELRRAAVVIVVAGMDGALASVVGGLIAQPVIAVPTSAGYGAALNGLAPLLTMLTSCAPGVVVVNVDNGYGAAYAATRINQSAADPLTGQSVSG